jgi:hypothetical protein
MKKWNRKLGTSKREQGIITPKRQKALQTPRYIARIFMDILLHQNFTKLSPENQEYIRRARMGEVSWAKYQKELKEKAKKEAKQPAK